MIRSDYVLRLIEQLGPFLKKIFGFRQVHKKQEAQAAIHQAFREVLNLDARLVLSLAVQDLKKLLSLDEAQGVAKCIVAGDLLAEYAGWFEAEERAGEGRSCLVKALELYLHAWALPGGRPHVSGSERFQKALAKVQADDLSEEAREILARLGSAIP